MFSELAGSNIDKKRNKNKPEGRLVFTGHGFTNKKLKQILDTEAKHMFGKLLEYTDKMPKCFDSFN